MTSNRPVFSRTNLASGSNFSIDVVSHNNYTYAIQISQLPSHDVLQIIPIDPTDNTIAGTIDVNALSPLGAEAKTVLQVLSEKMSSQLGAKEFMIVSGEGNLAEFIQPEENAKFTRFRHGDLDELKRHTKIILSDYPNIAAELDKRFNFVSDEKSLMAGRDCKQRYQEVTTVLEKSRFTSGKLEEYKNEELQGKISRFKSEFIRPIVMLDEQGNIAGMVRVLMMGNQFAYLSDEVMNQDIISWERFSGTTEAEKKQNREMFLLAYLMNKVCQFGLADQNHVVIIAAKDREDIYEDVGFKEFPLKIDGWNAVMKFGPKGPLLETIQRTIKALPLPENKPTNHWHYGKYIGMGAALLVAGLFAYRYCKGGTADAEATPTSQPSIQNKMG